MNMLQIKCSFLLFFLKKKSSNAKTDYKKLPLLPTLFLIPLSLSLQHFLSLKSWQLPPPQVVPVFSIPGQVPSNREFGLPQPVLRLAAENSMGWLCGWSTVYPPRFSRRYNVVHVSALLLMKMKVKMLMICLWCIMMAIMEFPAIILHVAAEGQYWWLKQRKIRKHFINSHALLNLSCLVIN